MSRTPEEKAQHEARKSEKAIQRARERELHAAHVAGVEFAPWPHIKRLNREIVITEKIDGTNAAILIDVCCPEIDGGPCGVEPARYRVRAQSRTKVISPWEDNAGFARWVQENAELLVKTLGVGRHFGEWWGQGIQRGYGLTEKRFSLFNVEQWGSGSEGAAAILAAQEQGLAIGVVPVLYRGPWQEDFMVRADMWGGPVDVPITEKFAPDVMLQMLRYKGSLAAPGFMRPEGIVVFHKASGTLLKATVEKDEMHKFEVA